MTAALPSGPFATADAIQTLKARRRLYERLTLREEIGDRAYDHAVEVTRCGHRIKSRIGGTALWQCVSDSHNARVPGCGVRFTLTYTNGAPTWTPTKVAEVAR